MRRTRIAIALYALCGLCGLGCGGDDDGGGAVSTGLPPGKRLSELSADEVMQACGELVASLDVTLTAELERFNCTVRAIPMSISVTLGGQANGDPARCRELRDRCLGGEDIGGSSDPAMTEPVGSRIQCSSPAAVAASQSCDATVGEYEGCLNAIVANAQASLRALDCELVSEPEELQGLMRPPSPPQPQVCIDLDAACPQLGIPATGASVSP